MRKILTIASIYLFVFCLPFKAYATTLFQDNFEDGPGKWETRIGDPNLWRVEEGKLKFIINPTSTFSAINSEILQASSYIIEFDYYPISGEDKNISFRWNDNLFYPYYDIHFNNSGSVFSRFNNYEGWPKLSSYTLINNNLYHFKIILDNQKIKIFINGTKIYDIIDEEYAYIPSDKVGLWATTGASAPTEVWFDNIIVKSIDEEPEEADLNVPLLKQTSDPWQAQIYDSANLWSPATPTINRWGCALTSAAMILQYYGITKMPDATPSTPDKVNDWLKMQSDGYIGNGLINWLAITRLTKLAKQSGFNPGFAYDALEYTRYTNSSIQLASDINAGQPDILEEPGHFVVAKGINGNTFSINDPFYNRTQLDDGYNNTFTSISHYTPSNTDLSYIMLTIPSGINVALSDEFNNPVGEQFIQQPIVDPIGNQQSGPQLKIVYLKKPLGENYSVKLSSTNQQSYVLTSYFYDKNGNVKVFKNSGILSSNSNRVLPIIFDKNDSTNSNIKKDVTFQSIIEYINTAQKQGKIKGAAAKSLIILLKDAEKSYLSKNTKLAKLKLATTEVVLLALKKSKGVTGEAYNVISVDLKELITSLK